MSPVSCRAGWPARASRASCEASPATEPTAGVHGTDFSFLEPCPPGASSFRFQRPRHSHWALPGRWQHAQGKGNRTRRRSPGSTWQAEGPPHPQLARLLANSRAAGRGHLPAWCCRQLAHAMPGLGAQSASTVMTLFLGCSMGTEWMTVIVHCGLCTLRTCGWCLVTVGYTDLWGRSPALRVFGWGWLCAEQV